MANKIAQFRYYNEKDGRNYPSIISEVNLASGSVFTGYTPIVQLGIQALPGTKFYLNNGIDPIVIGMTGIYELDLKGLSAITNLSFDLNTIRTIANNPTGYLLIDVIYEGV